MADTIVKRPVGANVEKIVKAAPKASNKSTAGEEEVADEYKTCIVTLENDPYRKAHAERRKYEDEHPETVDWSKRLPYRGHDDFGGPVGVTCILVFSHLLIWFFSVCLKINDGLIITPNDATEFFTGAYAQRVFNLVLEHCTPAWYHIVGYVGFLLVQAVFAVTLPGIYRWGEPTPELQGKKLRYLLNGVCTFWVTFTGFFILHITGIFPYTTIIDNIAPLATCAMLTADLFTVAIYYNIFGTGAPEKNISHNFFYDMFIGRVLNPRIGSLDIKMFFEVRVSWIVMSAITTSAMLKFYEVHGYVSNNMIIISTGMFLFLFTIILYPTFLTSTFLSVAFYSLYYCQLCFMDCSLSLFIHHLSSYPSCITIITVFYCFSFFALLGICLYSYAIMKGEHLILPTWDIAVEYYGGMLCFWNSALPFLYSAQSVFILRQDPANLAIPDVVFYVMMTMLFATYYVFDTVNSQKNTFRQQYNGTFEPRPWAIPQWSYGTLSNARYLRTRAGTPLLIDGWYSVAKKVQYTSDTMNALLWSLSCGFNFYFIPKFYFCFFFGMLMHRMQRDFAKCKRKYGADWDEYCRLVPWNLIPGIY